MKTPDPFVIGTVIGCFGIKGVVKVQPHTHSPERFSNLGQIHVGVSTEKAAPYDIEEVVFRKKIVLVKFKSVSDRTTAEMLIGHHLFIAEDAAARPAEGSYFIHEIIGCSVYSVGGADLGVVEDVFKLPTQDLWSIRRNDSHYSIPAVKEFIKEVDTANRRIVVDVIDGLLDE